MSEPIVWLILAAIALYVIERRLFHRATCRFCKGTGVWRSPLPFSRGERDCPRCGGGRKRRRLGSPDR